MLTSMSAFVPSEILHGWQSYAKQRYSVSIVAPSLLIKRYVENLCLVKYS